MKNATGDAMKSPWPISFGIGIRLRHHGTTFHDETDGPKFGEQAVLGGGVVDLMGGSRDPGGGRLCPENAYFECIHGMKLIIDLINKGRRGCHELLHLRHRGVRRVCLRPPCSAL